MSPDRAPLSSRPHGRLGWLLPVSEALLLGGAWFGAALLGAAGHEVWAVDRWRAHIEAIAENGLRLEGASGDRTVALQTSETGAEVGTADLVIVATKAMHIEAAAEIAAGILW